MHLLMDDIEKSLITKRGETPAIVTPYRIIIKMTLYEQVAVKFPFAIINQLSHTPVLLFFFYYIYQQKVESFESQKQLQ